MSTTKIGVLYSTTTGIVLRVINPDNAMGDAHLDWLDANKSDGTTLLRVNKIDVGATEQETPTVDVLIPHAKDTYGIDLKFGINCSVIDEDGVVIENVIACPDLYQKNLDDKTTDLNNGKGINDKKVALKLLQKTGNLGDVYNVDQDKFEKPLAVNP